MGMTDRDWYREPESGPCHVKAGMLFAFVLAAALLVGVTLHLRNGAAAGDPEHQVHRDLAIRFGPGLKLELARAPLYAHNDPWKKYLADEVTCPNAESAAAPLHEQALTMICLIDFARRQRGLADLSVAPLLSASVRFKGEDIVRCRVFAHAPCGGDPHDVAVRAGYQGSWGENLAIGGSRFGAPRPMLDGWLNSPGHRENLFRPDWRVQSIYVVKLDEFPGGFKDATLWVSEFGDL